MAVFSAPQDRDTGDKIDPSRAPGAAGRWRRAVAEALGQDPGASLDQPDRRLLMLRVFGATRRLAALCMTHPVAAAQAITEGASSVIAEAARDLSALERGVGGPDALHAALAPLKNRADLATALAELGGQWSVADATAARVDFAERLAETALRWLTRAAVKRGELSVADAENFTSGVFVLAGGDFAHEDLAPYGPLDLVILYDDQAFTGPAARGADRVFVRIGAEMRETFEGKPGEYPLFALRTPLGSGVGGAGYADSIARIRATAEGPQSHALKTWLATARVVAGDRQAGGVFLENIESLVWGDKPIITDEFRETLEKDSDDPRAVFRRVAELCRLAIGGARPVFRTSSAREIFETATQSNAISFDAARRLIGGEELAHLAVSRAQMMKGAPALNVKRPDEEQALAALCGFAEYSELAAALHGAGVDAKNTLRRLARGPQEEIARYRGASEDGEGDAGKLEDLGFLNGVSLSAAIDEWMRHAKANSGDARFSAHAPGLLTEFGETQNPDAAVRLFDALICNANKSADVFSLVRDGAPQRDALIDALGCFGAAVAPLTVNEKSTAAFFEKPGAETPQTGREWLARFTPPSLDDGLTVDDLADWRRQSIARISLSTASGAMSFDAAGQALDAIHVRTLSDVFALVQKSTAGAPAAGAIALHVFEGAGGHLPGSATHLGFIAADDCGDDGEAFARHYLDTLGQFGEGVFAITPDLMHRPSGTVGPLAPGIASFKSYVQSEAVAHDQIMLARGRVIAGDDAIREKACDALRGAVSGARRADILFRDLDRARAQRMRRERPVSDWDIDRLEGGRLDVELVISALIYRHAPAHPIVQESGANEALEAMARSGLISEENAQSLKGARDFWTRLQVVRALGNWDDPIRSPVRRRFGAMIARAAGVERFEQVRPLMRGYAEEVTRNYSQLVLGRPVLNLVAQAAG